MKLPSLLLLLGSGLMLQTQAADPPSARLNIVHIIADDLNNDLGCYGHPLVKSPNIDRLAARGVRFDRAYCSYPVCNPSRTSFLSGKRPETTRVIANRVPTRTYLKDSVLLPQFFRQHGWVTRKVGKIFHLGDAHEDPASWDSDVRDGTIEPENPPREHVVRRYTAAELSTNGRDEWIVIKADDADTWDGKAARLSVAILEKAAREGKPFYLATGFRRPHAPYIAPQKYFDLYPPEKITWPVEPPEHLSGIPPLALTYKNGDVALTKAEHGPVTAAYFASISFMDAQVGLLLDALDRLQLWDKTIVIFHSDHGYHHGEHGGLHHKMTLFEEGVRVPLIVAAPGAKAGSTSPRLVELVDLYPTLADLNGLTPPRDLEGSSFRPLLSDPDRSWKRAAFTVVGRRTDSRDRRTTPGTYELSYLGRTVRTERWRYTEWPDGTSELYDQDKDPREYVNLADRPEHAETRAELNALLKAGWRSALPL